MLQEFINAHGVEIAHAILCFVAAFMNGRGLSAAAELAVNFTYNCIKDTIDSPDRREYGIFFEKRLASLGAALEG